MLETECDILGTKCDLLGTINVKIKNKMLVILLKQLITNARGWGVVVKAEDSQLSGCGFEPRHPILDGCKPCYQLHLKDNENKGR
jgi:hypothetical protein